MPIERSPVIADDKSKLDTTSDTNAKVTDTDASAGGSKIQVESEEIVTSGGKTYTRRRRIWVNPDTAQKINQRRQATDWARSLGNYLPLYFVGNFVRDKYMKRVSESIDIIAVVPLPDTAKMLERLGIAYKIAPDGDALLLHMDKMEMRITAMDVNSLVEQLARSDFTMNAIAQSVTGTFYDPFSGLVDIKSKTLRSPYSNSKHAFTIDPTRIIRAGMYVGEFGLTPHPSLVRGLVSVRDELKQVNPKLIGDEFRKIMTCSKPAAGLEFLRAYSLLDYIDPDIAEMVDMPQNQPKHRHDVWKHTMTVLQRAKTQDPIANLAILYHDIGKTKTANEDYSQFPDHSAKGAAMAIDSLTRLGFETDEVKRVANLVRYHTFLCDDADRASTGEYRKVRLAVGTDMDLLIRLTYIDRESCKDNDTKPLERAIKRLQNMDMPTNMKTLSPLSISEITDKLGITGGSMLGELQDHLHEEVLLDQLSGDDKDGAVEEAKNYVSNIKSIKKSLDDIIAMVE